MSNCHPCKLNCACHFQDSCKCSCGCLCHEDDDHEPDSFTEDGKPIYYLNKQFIEDLKKKLEDEY